MVSSRASRFIAFIACSGIMIYVLLYVKLRIGILKYERLGDLFCVAAPENSVKGPCFGGALRQVWL